MERRFGSAPEHQVLQLKDTAGDLVATMADDEAALQSYGAQNDFTIHVVDSDPNSILSEFNDLSKVDKYVISEEDYAGREDTFRKFKAKKMAEDPNFMNAHQQ